MTHTPALKLLNTDWLLEQSGSVASPVENWGFHEVASQVLFNNRTQFASLINSVSFGVWEWNISTDRIIVNKRFAEMLGYRPGELYPLTIEDWYSQCHPDDLKTVQYQLQNLIDNQTEYYDGELRLKHKNGHWLWLKISGKVTQADKLENPLLICGTCIDISKRKVFEQDLTYRLEVEELITRISSSFVGVGTDKIDIAIDNAIQKIGQFADVDRSYVFLIREENGIEYIDNTHEWCNNGVKSQKENLQNLPCSAFPWWMGKLYKFEHINLFQLSDMPPEANAARQVLESQNIQSLLVIPIQFKSRLLGFMGFDSVKTKKKWLQEDISLLLIVGEIVGSALNHYENEKKLIAAKVKAETADKLKTTFMQNLSHEIRTPLNGIMGFSELLGNSKISESKKTEYVEIIHECGQQLLGIVENLIRISTIESGNEKIRKGAKSVNDIIFDLTTLYEAKAEKIKLKLNSYTDLSNRDSIIYTDVVKLQQILTNLLNNALKFTQKGFIEFGYLRENDFLKFYVKDTGIGIAPEQHEKIFERFRQIDSSTSRKFGGNGLGLSIAKSYTELMGGKIWLESSFGKGSAFYFTIPYNPAKEIEN